LVIAVKYNLDLVELYDYHFHLIGEL